MKVESGFADEDDAAMEPAGQSCLSLWPSSFVVRLACVFSLLLGSASPGWTADKKGEEFFERRIRPVLVKQCYSCHSSAAAKIKGGLRVDSRAAIRAGGESGPAAVPGNVNKSLLIEALRYQSFKMPPSKQLPKRVIADFVKWVEMGAPDPRDRPPSAAQAAEQSWDLVLEKRKAWWSLQPAAHVLPPAIAENGWSDKPIDRFILSRLREQRLEPAADADALTLLRRLSFVLTGLPPKPKLVQSFPVRFSRNADQAIAGLVDELLESPHFGERMARHWMDVVRFTDTYGYEWDNPAKGSWEFRDYLIRAFNKDVGFDQLISEQVAGDLLGKPRIDRGSGFNESLIGPMFYHMGEHRHGDNVRINGVREEMIDNKIDAFSKAFLSMTIACARCHNHKLDAVSQRDYYALAGVFMTPRWTSRSIEAPGKNQVTIEKLKALRADIREQLETIWTTQAGMFSRELMQALVAEPLRDSPAGSRQALWRTALGLANSDKKSPSGSETKDFVAAKDLDGLKLFASRLVAVRTDVAAQAVWNRIAGEWKTVRTARQAGNAGQFKTLISFDRPELPSGWVIDGDGMRHGYGSDGTPLVALKGDAVLQGLLARGYHTHSLSSKLPGALRMPRQEDLPGKFVSVELAGAEWSGSIRMADNAFQTEAVKFLDRRLPVWEAFADVKLTNGLQRISHDLVTSDLNPNFPPRTGVAKAGQKKLPDTDTGFDKRSWFGVTKVVTHDKPGQPADELSRFSSLLIGKTPKNVRDAAERIGKWLAGAVADWATGRADGDDVKLLNWLLAQGLLTNTASPESALGQLLARYREVEEALPFPRTANSMDERSIVGVDYRLNIRGSIHDRGLPVPRGFLRVFSGENRVRGHKGSGRLELAEFLVSRRHAFTARVYVNRLWQWMFGSGLVRTPSDFGRLGDRPSHPKLLDYLAREFIAAKWSSKQMIRRLVLSRSFRQSGRRLDRAVTIDPYNRLWHHMPTRRLEAESVRDTLLAVSGRLDDRLFGRPIDPYRHAEDSAKRLFSGPLDGNGRRSIYLKVSIMDPSRFLLSFDFPDPKLPTGRRDVTNVPAQALVLLNNRLVLSLAKQWAGRLVQESHSTPEVRIGQMFIEALGRPPRPDELIRWTALLRSGSTASGEMLMKDQAAWKDVAHTLFNTKEFIHFR